MACRMERVNERIVTAFAQVPRRKRRSTGLSQEVLAERADISARNVSFLETGRRQPSLSLFASLSTALDVSMSDLAAAVEEVCRSDADDDSGA